jgi:hypothetical protein
MTSFRFAACFSAIALVSVVRPAAAADAEAEAAIARGVELRRAHEDAAALDEFRRAQALEATPRALAQIALAEAALGRWVVAEGDLLRALAAEDDWIARQRAALQVALKEIQAHLGSLDVASVAGAELWVDGALAAQLPSPPVRVTAGRVVVEVRAAGHQPATRTIDVAPGSVAREAIALQPLPPRADAVIVAAPAPIAPVAPSDPGRSRSQRVVAWATLGGAAALAATGIAFWRYGQGELDRYNDDAACGPRPSERCATERDHVRLAGALEGTSFVLAGIAAASSAVLFLSLPKDAKTERAAGFCTLTLGGVSCAHTY